MGLGSLTAYLHDTKVDFGVFWRKKGGLQTGANNYDTVESIYVVEFKVASRYQVNHSICLIVVLTSL